MTTLQEARRELQRAGSELNPQGRWPVDLEAILDHLGISWRFSVSGESGSAYLILNAKGDKPLITLTKSDSEEAALTSRDRFSIAHELGHWVLWHRLRMLPAATRTEYWKYEDLCNQFATELLVPSAALRATIRQSGACIPATSYPRMVAEAAQVTWQVAARAISALRDLDFAYLRIALVPAVKPIKHHNQEVAAQKLARSGYFVVKCSSLSLKPGSYIGQNARIHYEESVKWMWVLHHIVNSGTRKTFRLRTTLSFGALRLNDVPCEFSLDRGHWACCFQASHEGVRVGEKDGKQLSPNISSVRPQRCSDAFRCSLVSDNEQLLRPVQRMAIENWIRRGYVAEEALGLFLEERFSKLILDQLTKPEADAALEWLRRTHCRWIEAEKA